MSINKERALEDLTYQSYYNPEAIEQALPLYYKIKLAATQIYYNSPSYGETDFSKKNGLDERKYIFPASMFSPEEGRCENLEGDSDIRPQIADCLKIFSQQENFLIIMHGHGATNFTPYVNTVEVTAKREVLEEFQKEMVEEHVKDSKLLEQLIKVGLDITKITREDFLYIKKKMAEGDTHDYSEPIVKVNRKPNL